MNWVQRKIYLYNVTFGLYMLDWWERFLFNMLVLVLMWFVCYNGFRYALEVCKRGNNGFLYLAGAYENLRTARLDSVVIVIYHQVMGPRIWL